MATVDDRLNALETEVAVLRKRIAEQNKSNWIAAVSGSFRNEPAFDEVLQLGREARQREGADSSNGTGS